MEVATVAKVAERKFAKLAPDPPPAIKLEAPKVPVEVETDTSRSSYMDYHSKKRQRRLGHCW